MHMHERGIWMDLCCRALPPLSYSTRETNGGKIMIFLRDVRTVFSVFWILVDWGE